MSSALVLTIRLHDERYHGAGDWPPAPARVFQALVAGAARGNTLAEADAQALRWLEGLGPPEILAPVARRGQRVKSFVPNNDADGVFEGRLPAGKIRTDKIIQPWLFERGAAFIYSWNLDEPGQAQAVCGLAERLYQLGRGVDGAWAVGQVVSADEAEARLQGRGERFRATGGADGTVLAYPIAGSLSSLVERFEAQARRFQRSGSQVVLAQAPRPRFSNVCYNSRPSRRLFELRSAAPGAPFAPWPLVRATELVTRLREAAAFRLKEAGLEAAEHVIVGRTSKTEADKRARVRVIPVPSTGSEFVDMGIRRVLVEVPSGCPLAAEDVFWSFNGLPLADVDASLELHLGQLVPANDESMLEHYGVGRRQRTWRTVTPAALPGAARRRLEPTDVKAGLERSNEENQAMAAVLQALRHAGVEGRCQKLRVQREPFRRKGRRAEAFAPDTRFEKERLWHVELQFAEAIEGPLMIGDGRFAGLGLLECIRKSEDVFAFSIVAGLSAGAGVEQVARAMRRAVMSRAQDLLPRGEALPPYFSGHQEDGKPAESHPHFGVLVDQPRQRILVVAPHRLGPVDRDGRNLGKLNDALAGLSVLRAGQAGRLELESVALDEADDPLLRPALVWESLTGYRPTRHSRRLDAADQLRADLLAELLRRRYPEPRVVEVLEVREGRRGGLEGRFRLEFAVPVAGPLALGRTSHLGGGVFLAC